jgi:hypothetical protein
VEKFVIDFIVNGLIGGLVATFLTLVIRRMWLSIIVPWYEERVYHDAHFEGRWEGSESFSDTDPPLVDRVKLVENGRKFVGHGAFYSPATERVHASTFEAVRQS